MLVARSQRKVLTMPRISDRELILRAQAIHHYRVQHPNATTAEIARGTGLTYKWVHNHLLQVLHGINSKAHQTFTNASLSYENTPAKASMMESLKDNPPTTLTDAWKRLNQFGVKCTPTQAKRYLIKWGLPVPKPTRGRGAPPKINKKLEALRSELIVLCMQHPNAVPTALIKELLE